MKNLFIPPAKFQAEWWTANRDVSHHTGPDELHAAGIANENAWVVESTIGCVGCGRVKGVVLTVFPTATDVMNWLRIHVLGKDSAWRKSHQYNLEKISHLEDKLRQVRRGTRADDHLREITPAFCREFYDVEILAIRPIHDLLNELTEDEDNEQYMWIANRPGVVRKDGCWSMSQAHWDAVNEFFTDMCR